MCSSIVFIGYYNWHDGIPTAGQGRIMQIEHTTPAGNVVILNMFVLKAGPLITIFPFLSIRKPGNRNVVTSKF